MRFSTAIALTFSATASLVAAQDKCQAQKYVQRSPSFPHPFLPFSSYHQHRLLQSHKSDQPSVN
ncbi:predicted protein [Plenodomus lingam JN3]|uniref:Predicted protein n=1 Tax=Leptosphaeria maculans (strain JN3 / isolate v23.1.3 / race Av1-4-5-6-7-8) TaxID=985895 RepID=E5R4B6_LEPMJ|nr:predicted protein [Plenodomus lingam JN3]CBX91884.1 predicted protein [Plenodomus lingam JN3]